MSPVTHSSDASTGKLGSPKVSLACNFCRGRKRRCDGVRPVCGQCRMMKNPTCTFDVYSDKRRSISRSYISALEAEIEMLRAALRAKTESASPGDTDGAELGGNNSQGTPTTSEAKGDIHDEVDDGQLPEDSGASVDAILNIGRLQLCVSKTEMGDTTNGDSSNFYYYGPTSSHHLVSIGESEPSLPDTYIQRHLDARAGTNILEDKYERALLERFWMWQDIHGAAVDRELFLMSYRDGERDSEWVSPLLTDMMLAIGARFGHQGHEERRAVYAARAEATLLHELGRPRMATIQAVYLMALFEMGAGRVSVGWSLNGLAVALSNRLGLHIDSTDLVTRGMMSQSMQTMRDTAFWGVFVLDRIFSILMGVHPLHSRRSLSTRRPPGSIRNNLLPNSIKLAGGDPDEAFYEYALSSPHASSIRVRDLCDIVETMLTDIYAFDSPDRSAMDEYNLITKNARVIQVFVDDLPAHLRTETSGQRTDMRFVMLHVTINMFVIMLNRPFLGPHRSKASAASGNAAPPASIADQAIERRYRSLAFGYCRTSALRVIALIGYFIKSPCFTTAYEIFSACTILLLSPQDPEAMDAVRAGLGYLDRLRMSHYWSESAEDSKRRIWALAKRWNVRPLLDDLEGVESTVSSASTSDWSPKSSAVDIDIPALADTTTVWGGPISFGCNAFSAPEMGPSGSNAFTGPDAALFATFPSAELGIMYEELGSQMELTQETGSWWFMGSQPFMQLGGRSGGVEPDGS